MTDDKDSCPTDCDFDCDTGCHEAHQPSWRRDHDPETCPGVCRIDGCVLGAGHGGRHYADMREMP